MQQFKQVVFLVTKSQGCTVPLHLSFRFDEAKSFVLSYNRMTATGRAVIRSGQASISYDETSECRSESTS